MGEICITSSPSFSAVLRDTSQKHLFNMTLKALAAGLELVLLSDRGIFPLCTTFLSELLRKLTYNWYKTDFMYS